LVKGVAKGYFKSILASMRQLNYTVESRLINAAWLGVPQSRERLFFLGVRHDLNKKPAFPKPLNYYYTLGEIFPYIKQVKKGGTRNNWVRPNLPSPTITQSAAYRSISSYFDSGGWIESETDITGYAIGSEWDKLKQGEHSDRYFNLYRSSLQRPSHTITASGGSSGSASVTHPTEKRKFSIEELKQVCSFPNDFQLTGTFAQQWERIGRAVPPFMARAIAETIRDEIL
jgi:DNA (cytosine-5)-methyltransferase 1